MATFEEIARATLRSIIDKPINEASLTELEQTIAVVHKLLEAAGSIADMQALSPTYVVPASSLTDEPEVFGTGGIFGVATPPPQQ